MASYTPPRMAEPEPHGFIYLGFDADRPRRLPLARWTAKRRAVADRLISVADALERRSDVASVRVLRTHLVPPLSGVPRHDLALLIRTRTVAELAPVREAEELWNSGGREILVGVNAARFGDTESDPGATFLLNHFVATTDTDPVPVWLSLTGWYADTLGVDNSTALRATETSGFSLVNYVRLPSAPPRFLLGQLVRPSFYRVVGSTLKANGLRALPIFCRMVR